ncbi:hypothetical protein DPX16_16171 [Anabarilius grahami]|uniref:Uncharacterized protein n=1 Tax=Anabarilius grahami TaxID=495550 RepID=A0A3N0YGW6_ANAGA|nr:hypothetical protein DPX16_16171 [Anabarilius grahami]
MAELDRFPGHRIEDGGARRRGGILRSTPGMQPGVSLPILTHNSSGSFLTPRSSPPRGAIEMSFKMAEIDRFPGHGLEEVGARKRGSINLSIEKHPASRGQPSVPIRFL